MRSDALAKKADLAPFGLLRERVKVTLGLDAHPVTNVGDVLAKANISTTQCLDFLRNSGREEAYRLLHATREVTPDDLPSTPIDYLLSWTKITPPVFYEILAGAMATQEGALVSMFVAMQHLDVMKSTVEFAKQPEGFQDRRMVLQIAGSAPVPKTAITNLTVRGNVNQTQVNMSVPRLEDVTRNVDAILEGL